MNKTKTTSLLATFATIKSLSDAKKYESHYQILAEFIRYIISTESLHSFSPTQMKDLLHDYFMFVIPESVVKTTAKSLPETILSNGIFSVSVPKEANKQFLEMNAESDTISSSLINSLVEYVQSKAGDRSIHKEKLTKQLIGFLVDEQRDSADEYIDLISEFVLKNEHNDAIQAQLKKIREGSILYIGLNHNIGETGNITKPLTLYLSTEILFSLAGYNGVIYKQLADDFFVLVREANIKSNGKITLRYFNDTKQEIDDFFFAAERILEGNFTQLNSKPAMIAITNGCSSVSDILVKKSDFFHMLEFSYGIKEDPVKSYYTESLFESNLESFDYIDEEDKRQKKEHGIKLVSNINKLREGRKYPNEIESEYLLITNAKATLLISEEQTATIHGNIENEPVANFAVSLYKITNLLWYKLGNGFGGKEYPANVNAVLRARIILSASIAKNAEVAFSDTKEKFKSGIITEDQLTARIITLRNKPTLPEELRGDCIDEMMDFSPEYLSRYEEKVKADQKSLEEKEAIIESIKEESVAKDKTISEQEDIILNQKGELFQRDDKIAAQDEVIQNQKLELESFHRIEKERKQRKERKQNILKFIGSLILKLLLLGMLFVGIVAVVNLFFKNLNDSISNAIGIAGVIIAFIPLIRSDYKKYFPNKNKGK